MLLAGARRTPQHLQLRALQFRLRKAWRRWQGQRLEISRQIDAMWDRAMRAEWAAPSSCQFCTAFGIDDGTCDHCMECNRD